MAEAQGLAAVEAVLEQQPLRTPTVLLVGDIVAGIETQFRNVVTAAQRSPDVIATALPVRPYHDDFLERRLGVIPASTRGSLRQLIGTKPLFLGKRPDAVWTQLSLPLLPWLYTANMVRQVPVVYTMDSTPRLLREFGADYKHWGGRSAVKNAVRDHLYARFLQRASIVNPWTEWAAHSMCEDYGLDPARVRVLPPGVDVDWWRRPSDADEPRAGRRLRLLFVGGDFERKGGDLLVRVYLERLRRLADLDLVTRADIAVAPAEGIRVHSGLGPNDPRLRDLYHQADVFVLPTRADCFSVAGMEAMAAGVPVVISPVGGVAELLEDGRQGYFVAPDDARTLAAAVERLLDDDLLRRRMGAEARRLAERRYDAERNTAILLGYLAAAARGEVPPANKLD